MKSKDTDNEVWFFFRKNPSLSSTSAVLLFMSILKITAL